MVHYYANVNDGVVNNIQIVADSIVDDKGEQAGADLLNELFGGFWVRFSKSGDFRANPVNFGSLYDASNDVFHDPQPYPSWKLDDDYKWQPPTPKPGTGEWYWDEGTLTWVQVDEVV